MEKRIDVVEEDVDVVINFTIFNDKIMGIVEFLQEYPNSPQVLIDRLGKYHNELFDLFKNQSPLLDPLSPMNPSSPLYPGHPALPGNSPDIGAGNNDNISNYIQYPLFALLFLVILAYARIIYLDVKDYPTDFRGNKKI